ncbi:AMP-dependent synthetase/ligase [Haliangium sp.]|uniref:AMP-dependent synthetase/ligase n=1 Tax=Haliangium sp. TaxID=2663208 RepID=UPI003D145D23
MTEPFTSLVDVQERACALYAQKRLFGTKIDGVYRWISYAEFASLVERFRAALARLGVERGDKVAVISNNRVEWAVGAYATYGLGGHYVPMYEAQQEKDWAYILRDSAARVLLVSTEEIHGRTQKFLDEIDTLQHIVCFEAPAQANHSYRRQLEIGAKEPVPSIEPAPEEVAGLIYTSGTTGNPKGVILTHGNFCSNINAVHAILPIEDDDVTCSFLPWAHSFGQTAELHTMLSRGAAMGLAESVQTLVDNFAEIRPTVLLAVPRIFNRIYDGLQKRMAEESPVKRFLFQRGMAVAKQRRELSAQGRRSLRVEVEHRVFDRLVFAKVRDRFGGRLRHVISGGAALSQEVAEFIDDIGLTVYEGYGLTETSPVATTNHPDDRRLGTVGKPIPGVEIFICDDSQRPLPPDTDGEVVIVGPNVMQGYHGLPDATDAVIFDLDGKRAFRSGDMGRIDRDGYLRITGRFKEQYKLENGKYVVPTVLEDQLKLSGFISQAFIYGDNKPFNVCLVVPDFDAVRKWAESKGISATEPEALVESDMVHGKIGDELEHYGAEFKGYERPKKWALLTEDFTVDNGLLTPKMSVKRRNVIERHRAVIDGLYS